MSANELCCASAGSTSKRLAAGSAPRPAGLVRQRAVGAEPVGHRGGAGQRPGLGAHLGGGDRRAGHVGVARAVLQQDPHRRLGLVGRPLGLDVGTLDGALRRQRHRHTEGLLHDDRGEQLERSRPWCLLAVDVEVQEGLPLDQVLGCEPVDVGTVPGVQPDDRRVGEVVEHQRRPPADLLVLERRGVEDRDVDVGAELLEAQRVGDLGHVVRVAAAPWRRRRRSGRAAAGCRRRSSSPASTTSCSQPCPYGSALSSTFSAHWQREALVEDAARGEHAAHGVVVDRQRRDRRQAGRLGRGDEDLGDARVGQADHADLVVLHPVLRGDRLDDVVAVEQLQRLEEVVGAARAARAADVDRHDRVAQGAGDQRRRLVRCVAGERGELAHLVDRQALGQASWRARPSAPRSGSRPAWTASSPEYSTTVG